MPCVTFVFTVHEQLGIATATELHAILNLIQPEVVFLEVPAAALDDFYLSRTRRNLESDAVNLFRESHPGTKLIPVDLPTPAREFFEDHAQLCMRVRDASPEYRQLVRVDRQRLMGYGYAYLNSDYCDQHWTELRKAMLDALDRIADPRLMAIQADWDRTNELREIEILSNVRKFYQENHFENAVMLVGAAHRSSLTEKLHAQAEFNWSRLEYRGDA